MKKMKRRKKVYGLGYSSVGKYKKSENKRRYDTWLHMIGRCYNGKFPSYKGCSVCDEWLDFQNFAKWYDENYYTVDGEQMDLDKDILVKGNKIYSPDTCIFVPHKINVLFVGHKNEKRIRKMADKYKDKIPKKLYDAMLSYKDVAYGVTHVEDI